ncbi:MAG: aminotransferase class III-fold pyridoxal phosphate-dependent enzyme [Bifidobacterium tibiigranuli]|jgi:taurine--2-oxoglutarate transaminase|nr:aminotransferase class III-fold pyridoxal phosphate-dependent enzyme [Bifidobacterium tibiigranuli]
MNALEYEPLGKGTIMGHDVSADEAIWDDACALDLKHVFHSWQAQADRHPVEVTGGHGAWLQYADGREMLDFTSQQVNVNIGYQHPKVIEGIAKQAALLCTIGPDYANLARGRAASLVVRRAPEGFNKVFFTNAGADANENAIRAVRLFTGRDKILSSYRSYHGNTGAAISATGDWRRKPNDYARGHVHFFTPYLYRSEFSATTQEEECERALAHLEHVIQFEGPDTIAAILLESVPGTAGILTPPKDYFKGVREITKKYGILMITDEVMTGFGRTGFWLALDDYGYTPDIISFAKGCNSGYVPAGGVMLSDPIAHYFDDVVFPGGLTYSGHPLAMGAIVATQEAMEEEHIVDNAYNVGHDILGPKLSALSETHPKIGEVRGKGVFWAVEMVADRASREPLDGATMKQIVAEGAKLGLVLGVHDNRIHVTPPCVITLDEASDGVERLDKALTAAGC